MAKDTNMRFRWESARKSKFSQLAKNRKKKASDLGREIIEAWMICVMDPGERSALGMQAYNMPDRVIECMRTFRDAPSPSV